MALALAIGCCGALPVAIAFASSVAVGTLLGVVAGAVALIGVVGLVVTRARRRAACEAERRAGHAKSTQAL